MPTPPVTSPSPRRARSRGLTLFTASFAALAALITVALVVPAATAQQATPKAEAKGKGKGKGGPPVKAGSQTFNTVITKLKEGKQVFSNTITDPDLEAARKACEGQDFIWIEMQHATLTWRETHNLIKVIAEAGCIPFVRVPNANVGDIQKAVDAGALGIIIPMVETVQEAKNAVMFAKFPIGHRDNPNTKPWGHRSAGGGQAGSLWGPGYATNANNNIMIVLQIESPAGVGQIDNILEEVPGIDVVMVASNDFGLHGGDRDGDASYNAREKLVRESVLAHGVYLAGPSSWQDRPGYKFFQGRRAATDTGYPKQ